ncbi:MAG: xanthine dehydrogenase family protein subunit M, partial [Gammaproteobacteria bacterium]|nr:xanthine dehydrogenase family protein subunit M [Gammaproteobacteria bacterium]
PDTLEETLDLLAEHGEDVKILAGGQSLIPSMNFRMLQPRMLVDINRLKDLDTIRANEKGGVTIGAMARQASIEHSDLIAERAPLLHETLPNIAHPQIRNRGTLGGSLAHADPASELPVYALARQARMRVRSAKEERWVEAVDFFLGMFTTAINPGEMLAEIEIPPLPEGTGWSFQEMARRRGDYALMGLAALLTLDSDGICQDARLVYLNAGDGPTRATQAEKTLIGEKPGPEVFAAAASVASEQEIDPFGSVHATVEFQRHLAHVLTRRALQTAHERSQNGRQA